MILKTKSSRNLPMLFVATLALLAMMLLSCSNAGNLGLTNEECNNRVAVAVVHVSAVGLGEIIEGMDENQQIETIREFIDPIRFFDEE